MILNFVSFTKLLQLHRWSLRLISHAIPYFTMYDECNHYRLYKLIHVNKVCVCVGGWLGVGVSGDGSDQWHNITHMSILCDFIVETDFFKTYFLFLKFACSDFHWYLHLTRIRHPCLLQEALPLLDYDSTRKMWDSGVKIHWLVPFCNGVPSIAAKPLSLLSLARFTDMD